MDVITQEDAGAQQPIWSEADIIDVCSKLVAKRVNCEYLDVARAMVLLRLFDERSRKGAIRLARILRIERQVEDDWIRDNMQAWVTRVAAYFDRQPVEKKDRRPNGRRISYEDWEKIADLVASDPVPLKGKKLKERIDHLAHTTDGWMHLRKISESTLSRNARRIEQLVRRKRRGYASLDSATAGGEDAAIENAAATAQNEVVASGQLDALVSAQGQPAEEEQPTEPPSTAWIFDTAPATAQPKAPEESVRWDSAVPGFGAKRDKTAGSEDDPF
jgi:hypothetical protein